MPADRQPKSCSRMGTTMLNAPSLRTVLSAQRRGRGRLGVFAEATPVGLYPRFVSRRSEDESREATGRAHVGGAR